jgi:thiol-disulfide isomerase/thioredoxin
MESHLKRDPVVILIVAMVVSVMLAFGFNLARHAPKSSADVKFKNGDAPDFTLQSLDGRTVHLTDYRGKAVVLNFWATWCAPCKIEMPWFVELQKQYGQEGLQFVGVAMDDANPREIAQFAEDMGVNYPILVGKESVGDAYGGIPFMPETFFITRDGKLVDKILGLKGRGEIEDDIKKILGPGKIAKN